MPVFACLLIGQQLCKMAPVVYLSLILVLLHSGNGFPNQTISTTAWEAALKYFDICVEFGNPETHPDDIIFTTISDEVIELDGYIPTSVQKGKPFKFFTHGFTANPGTLAPVYEAYNRDTNIIKVDWRKDAALNANVYCGPAKQTYRVGHNIAKLAEYLIKSEYTVASQIHLVGHSLGAQASGFAGKIFANFGLGKIGRITGLDPAYPGFRLHEANRLSSNDADIVDIIHTNGKVDSELQTSNNFFHLGFSEPIGHYDFFPNGGFMQPGCEGDPFCSHSRAVEFFAESVNSGKAFYSKRCGSWDAFIGISIEPCQPEDYNYLGENLDSSTIGGSYYFCTEPQSPFDKGVSAGLRCKPTVCDMYGKQKKSSNNLPGLDLTLENVKYDQDILPNDNEFVGIEEINNNSTATVRHLVNQRKRTWEKYTMTSSRHWGKVAKICGETSWGGKGGCFDLVSDCGSSEPITVSSETESEFSLQREIIVPPNTRVHICSTVSVSKDTVVGFTGVARYTGEGLWAEELARILARDDIEGTLDIEGKAVLVEVSGTTKLSLALEPQFVVSEITPDGFSTCTQISKAIHNLHTAPRSERANRMQILENLING